MKAAEIRQRFLDYFADRGHEVRPSSSLIPTNDDTLLFTNAGMVQFKGIFVGDETVAYDRAVTSQKCVRAGGKHNDLEEVGRTARHHTFFEMLGNFSFGDYFKAEAIEFAWEFLTEDLGLDPERLFATVHHTDDEAAALWEKFVPPERIFRLGDKDNFWQMADTGPCGPCSELHYDLRPEGERTRIEGSEAFEKLGDAGILFELWNLVFMQFDRDAEGTLEPLPAPSIDTGAGLERLAAVLQGVDSNYHTDLFRPMLERAAEVVGRPYAADSEEGLSYRVLADHARSVAFLLGDGVFPSNEGRGYVLRRILRRAVRHAWLLGRREPTLVHIVDSVIDTMGNTFPGLVERRDHILSTTRAEEERFLTTVEGGLDRLDEIAPNLPPTKLDAIRAGQAEAEVVAGDEAFKLYDTFGFPIDLTALLAEERGYVVDHVAFEAALDAQRERSRQGSSMSGGAKTGSGPTEWTPLHEGAQRFVGWDLRQVETRVLATSGPLETDDGQVRAFLRLEENPFYAEGGGQVSDTGVVKGNGWSLSVDEAGRQGDQIWVGGTLHGALPTEDAESGVATSVDDRRRHDTERNHTATHLLHAALRDVLGTHVVQKGSLVDSQRLRFDFAHTAPMTDDQVAEVERRVNDAIWSDHPVNWDIVPQAEAVGRGAMALFGEKYGDEVRVVEVPGVSLELCGGTHVRHTGEIGGLRITAETGVAAGVRRIEAVTGPGVMALLDDATDQIKQVGRVLKATSDNVVSRAEQLVSQIHDLEGLLAELRKGGGAGATVLDERLVQSSGVEARVQVVNLRAKDADDARSFGDAFRAAAPGVAVVAAEYADGKRGLFTFVSDELVGRGVRADSLVKEVASSMGTSGGGRPHMAQAGVSDAEGLATALQDAGSLVEAAIRAALAE